MTLVQKGSMAWDRPEVTRPPGGQKAQHFTGVWGNLQQAWRNQARHVLQEQDCHGLLTFGCEGRGDEVQHLSLLTREGRDYK